MAGTKELSKEMREEIACVEQGTLDWFRARLGYITSSNVSAVMIKSRATKDNPNPSAFGKDALRYLYKVAAERNLWPGVVQDNIQFEEYLYRTDVSNKAIRYGQENEDVARKVYENNTKQEVVQAGFIVHPTIPNYGDSPDGIVLDENGKPIGTIEIKCPKPETFMTYKATIHNAEELKAEKPEYYWQCQSHCECNNLPWCDFIFFDKMQVNGFVCIRIERNEEDIAAMKERIVLANQFVDELLK